MWQSLLKPRVFVSIAIALFAYCTDLFRVMTSEERPLKPHIERLFKANIFPRPRYSHALRDSPVQSEDLSWFQGTSDVQIVYMFAPAVFYYTNFSNYQDYVKCKHEYLVRFFFHDILTNSSYRRFFNLFVLRRYNQLETLSNGLKSKQLWHTDLDLYFRNIFELSLFSINL